MTHYHVASGLAGYGPDASDSDGFARFDSLAEALQYVRDDELPIWIDSAHQTAHSLAGDAIVSERDYEGAWYEVVRMEDLETLRANLDPARRNAPLYADDPAAYEALQRDQLAGFPVAVAHSTNLYVWECDESHCDDSEDADEPSEWEAVSVSLLAVREDDVPAHLDVERIAERAVEALYVSVHQSLQAAEGFRRYGDAMPGEVAAMQDLGRLVVRSVIGNGRMETEPMRTYIVTNEQTMSVLMRTRAFSPLDALSQYSEREGFARPDRMTRGEVESYAGAKSLTEYLGYAVSEDGRSASITFTNTTLIAEEV